MKIKEKFEVKSVNVINKCFVITITEDEAKSLRDLLAFVKRDWNYDDNTLKILEVLNKELKEIEE